MRRSKGLFLGFTFLFFALAPAAFPQGLPTATLTGKVTAEGGTSLPGVTVTAESASLQGKRDTTTSGTGDYIFNLLPAGDYTITFALSGMRQMQKTINLGAAELKRMDQEMQPAAVAEAVTVSAEGSVAAILESTQVQANYKKDFIEKLPVGRTLAATTLMAPGVNNNGPGGNDRLASIQISGAPTYENLFLINGVVVNENLRGQPHDLFIEDAIQETTVLTAGISAEYGRFTGGVVNAITKSGGNRFSGSFRTSFTNDNWSDNDPYNEQTGGSGVATTKNDPRLDEINEVYEATLGGPFWIDRIWFFGAGRIAELSTSRETRPTAGAGSIDPTPQAYTNLRDTRRLEGKLTLQPFAGHNVVGSYIDIQDEEVNNSFTQNILDLDSLVTRQTPNKLFAINYNGVITDKLFVEAQYSEKEFTFENSGSPFTDILRGTLLIDNSRAGARYNSPTFSNDTPEQRDNESWLVKASYFLTTPKVGTHDIRLGYEYFHSLRFANNHQSGSDYRILGTGAILRGTEVFPVFTTPGDSTIFQWNPIFEDTQGTDFNTHSVFLNDRIAFNKNLSFNIGVRYDKNEGRDSRGFLTSDDDSISPRLAAQFDVRGDGRYVVNASYGQYVAQISDSVGDAASPAGVPATLTWFYRGPCINCDPNAPTSALLTRHQAIQAVFDWFNSIGGTGSSPTRSASVPGINTQILEGTLKSPNVKEYTLGFGAALSTKGFAKIDFIHRNWDDFYGTQTDLSIPPSDPLPPFVNRQLDVTRTINEDAYEREYNAIQTQVNYRVNRNFFGGVTYTWSRLTGNFDGENLASGPVTGTGPAASTAPGSYPEYKQFDENLPSGYLAGDQRHKASLWLGYEMPLPFGDVSFTVLETYNSGVAYDAVGAIDVRPFVTNPGYQIPPASVNYWFSQRGEFRYDDVTRTDIALNMNVRLWKTLEIFLQPELLNAFNEDAHIGGRLGTDTNVTVNTRVNVGAGFDTFDPNTEPREGAPSTTTPVGQRNHFQLHPNFGRAIGRDAYQLPRTFRFSVGIRF